ncbi:hypothetical protein BSKO_01884 [Bryopsis sp. KO-2023]|nr:hypothetical protein BSKO_01884 [Bryopsis sp. KO-2023]
MPNNGWVWRFLPGVIAGVVLSAFFRPKTRPRAPDDEGEVETVGAVDPDEEVKLIMIVNKGLKGMKPGKTAAQCGHAAAMVVKKLLTEGNKNLFTIWEECGQPKVVVKAQSRDEMEALGDVARASGMMVTTVLDAGRTQVEAGSMTVMAIGPAEKAKLNKITGHLPLM